MKKKKLYTQRLLGLFCLVSVFITMFVNLISSDKKTSLVENRSLQTFPEINTEKILNGTFENNVNTWFSDQFVGRDLYIRMHYYLSKMMGHKKIDTVYLCENQLIEQSEPVNKEQLKRNLSAINDFAKKKDLNTSFILIPNAVNIQNENLPLWADTDNQNAKMDSILDSLDKKIHKFDGRKALEEHKKEYLYYKTDHHWTSLAAFYTYEFWKGKEIDPVNYDIYSVSNNFQGTLSNKTGSREFFDTIEVYLKKKCCDYYVLDDATQEKSRSMYLSSALDTKEQYNVFLGGNKGIQHLEMDNNSDKHLLLFKDSYANTFIQFLIPEYRTITIVDARYYNQKADLLLDTDIITDVMYLYNTNTFVQDTSLADVLGD